MSSTTSNKHPYHFYTCLKVSTVQAHPQLWLANNGVDYRWSARIEATSPQDALLAAHQKIAHKGRLARFVLWQDETSPPQTVRAGDVLVGEKAAWMVNDSGTLTSISYMNGIEKKRYMNHSGIVYHVCWSPDGKYLAASDSRGAILIHQPATDYPLRYDRHGSHPVYALDWSSDGTRIASGDGWNDLHIWEVSLGEYPYASRSRIIICRPGGLQNKIGSITSVAWEPRGTRLLVVKGDGRLFLLDGACGTVIREGDSHRLQVTEGTWAPDGKQFLVASKDGTLSLYDPSCIEQPVSVLTQDTPIMAAAWSPDARQLVTTSYKEPTLTVWDVTRQKPTEHIPLSISFCTPLWAQSISWSPDGRFVAAACSDGTLQLFDAECKHYLTSYRTYSQFAVATAVAWSPDGTRIAVGYDDGSNTQSSVYVWPRPNARCASSEAPK